jgi:hypothetical protein
MRLIMSLNASWMAPRGGRGSATHPAHQRHGPAAAMAAGRHGTDPVREPRAQRQRFAGGAAQWRDPANTVRLYAGQPPHLDVGSRRFCGVLGDRATAWSGSTSSNLVEKAGLAPTRALVFQGTRASLTIEGVGSCSMVRRLPTITAAVGLG